MDIEEKDLAGIPREPEEAEFGLFSAAFRCRDCGWEATLGLEAGETASCPRCGGPLERVPGTIV